MGGAALVLIGGGVFAWGSSDGDPGAVRAADVGGITSIGITSGSGDVEVRHVPGAPGRVEEHRSVQWLGGDSNSIQHRVTGGELLLDTDCGWGCTIDYVVTLPDPVPVSGELGSGSLNVRGMSSVDADVGSGSVSVHDVAGTVRAKTGSGEIELVGLAGALDVRTGSGEINGRELGGRDVDAHTSSGGIDLQLVNPGTLDAETGSGEISLSVPQGAYRVDSETGSGETEIDVPQDPNSPRHLKLSTGSGSVLVGADS